jgi:hypothetical protein
MKSYLSIVLNRVLEVVSRFFFLGQCLKLFSLENYGTVSYKIALYQFVASMLYSGTLQSLSKYSASEHGKQRSILTTLFLAALLGTVTLALLDGTEALIFLFYGLLYIQNGWYGTQENQVLFSTLRSLAFVAQAVFFTWFVTGDLVSGVYQSFGAAGAVLLLCFPYRKLAPGVLPLHEWGVFFKFQLHNLVFQFTKIAERWTLLFILDKKTFGLYSSIRDLINAANLTFFSPVYLTYYKRLARGADYRPFLRGSTVGLLLFSLLGVAGVQGLGGYLLLALEKQGIAKFSVLDITLVVVLLALDFYKSVLMMLFESRHKFRNLFEAHFLDLATLCAGAALFFSSFTYYGRLFTILSSRLILVNSYYRWKQKEL